MTVDQLMAEYDAATDEQRDIFLSLKLPRAEVIRALEKYAALTAHEASRGKH